MRLTANPDRLYKPEGNLKYANVTQNTRDIPVGKVKIEYPGIDCFESKDFKQMYRCNRMIRRYVDGRKTEVDIKRAVNTVYKYIYDLHDFPEGVRGNPKCRRCGFTKTQVKKALTTSALKEFARIFMVGYRLRMDIKHIPRQFEPISLTTISSSKNKGKRGKGYKENWYKKHEDLGTDNSKYLEKWRQEVRNEAKAEG